MATMNVGPAPPVRTRWWSVALRGVVAILFGLSAFLLPLATLAVLTVFFGAFAFVDGVVALVFAASHRRALPAWSLVLEGIVGVLAGIGALVWPAISMLALVCVVATWALVRGAFEILAAFRLRRVLGEEWFLLAAGALSILAGALIALNPFAGAYAVAWLVGAYAITFGASLLAFALRLRRHRHA